MVTVLSSRATLCSPLAFEYNALQFFENNELFVRMIDLGVPLFFGDKEAGFFEPFEFTLNIAGILFDEFGQAADVRLKVGVFRINHNDLAAHSRSDKNIQHKLLLSFQQRES